MNIATHAEEEVPPLLRIALIYNAKRNSDPSEAEYDSPETIRAIQSALSTDRITVVPVEADEFLMDRLRNDPVDFAFNIAEGKNGRGREAQVPAILDMLGIPYSGSDPTTLCLSMDKTLCKRYLRSYNILSPQSLVFGIDSMYVEQLNFPILVKPNAEGSSKGILDVSLVQNHWALKEIVKSNESSFHGQMMAEEYIDGREFTVGLLGNGPKLHVFEPMEIVFDHADTNPIYSYEVKQNYTQYVHYECPSTIGQEKIEELKSLAKRIYKLLDCRDFARIDFRCDKNGTFYFIEINPLPGLAPHYSDYPMIAEFCGYSYTQLVRNILITAITRVNPDFSWRDYYA